MGKARYDGLTPEMPLGDAARSILRSLAGEMLSEAPGVLRNDVEATHKMRVAIRRLRTALATFDAAFPKRRLEDFRAATRRVGRRLGAVRDADVHLAVLRATLAGATEAEAPGIAYAIETLSARRRRSLAEFAIEYSQFDRDGLLEALGDGE
jgi:CHAD domain-containing protein